MVHSWLDWGENQQQVMQHCQVAIKENPAKNYILLLSRSKNSFPNLYCLHLTKTVCYINIAGWFYRALPPPVLIFLESDNKLNLDPPYVNHSWTTADRTTSLSLSLSDKKSEGFSPDWTEHPAEYAGPAKVKFPSIYGLFDDLVKPTCPTCPGPGIQIDNY